jgi:hypothetical protein
VAAFNVPVSNPATAGFGSARGMTVLATYRLCTDASQSLPNDLDAGITKSVVNPVKPDPRDLKGFADFFDHHKSRFAIGHRHQR